MQPAVDILASGSGGIPPRRPEAEKPETEPLVKPASAEEAQPLRRSTTTAIIRPSGDQADIAFQLNREEREVFRAAFTEGKRPADMTADERDTLRQASDRISQLVDDAIAKNAENRERVEKAVHEWYGRLVQGEGRAPGELIRLLHQAAMGELDDPAG